MRTTAPSSSSSSSAATLLLLRRLVGVLLLVVAGSVPGAQGRLKLSSSSCSSSSAASAKPNPFVAPPPPPFFLPGASSSSSSSCAAPLLQRSSLLIATARYHSSSSSLGGAASSSASQQLLQSSSFAARCSYRLSAAVQPPLSSGPSGTSTSRLFSLPPRHVPVCSASTGGASGGGGFFSSLFGWSGRHPPQQQSSVLRPSGGLSHSSMAAQDRGGGPHYASPPGGSPPESTKGLEVTATASGDVRGAAAVKVGGGKAGKKKVLILMSDTGGGHRASAQALESAFDELFPNQIEISIVDIWTDYAPWPYNQAVPAYQFMAKNPVYWKAFWEYGKFTPTKWGTEETSNIACHHRFKACIESHSPDLVISVHPLCQDIPLRVLNTIGNGRRQIPFVTVVTDLGGAHPTWFHKDVDLCFVPSDPVRKIALEQGLTPDQIRQHGLPIRPGFWKEARDKASLRKELQVKNDRTALVVGGGDGIGNLVEITEALAQQLSQDKQHDSQVVVICGKNEQIREQLLKKTWPSNVNVVVKGFVKNMDSWMGASDVIVTKAGPGTIAEASTRGLPVMLFNFLPGQEEGNVPFVTKGGFGDYSKEPDVIAKTVASWLADDESLASLSQKAKEAARPSSTTDIAREIGDLLFGDWQLPSRKDTEEKFRLLLKKLMEPVTF